MWGIALLVPVFHAEGNGWFEMAYATYVILLAAVRLADELSE
jgi:hypothetical protein